MSEPQQVIDLLRTLGESELVSDAHLKRVREVVATGKIDKPVDLAKLLVKQKLVTRFQAERLLSGRTRGYFIDDYRLLDLLGMGGIGMVYMSVKRGSDLLVALKTLSSAYQDDPGLKVRLEMEYHAGRRMDHPNVIRTLDRGVSGGMHFIATKYFPGITLQELIVRGGVPDCELTCDFMMQAAKGLQHIHDKRVIHRDIKLENLLVSKQGTLKIMDFGLSLLQDEGDAEFSLAMLFGQDKVGTADYVSPEQAEGSQDVDARSDLYSLGCTFYGMLTGRMPFPDPSQKKKLEGHRKHKPQLIRKWNSDAPDDVIAIVEQLMEKDPRQRIQTASELAARLKPFAKAGPVGFSFSEILRKRRDAARKKARSSQHSFAKRKSVAGLESSASSTYGADEIEIPDDSSDQIPIPPEHVTPPPEPIRPTLAILKSNAKSWNLTHERVLVGTSEACDIRINHPSVSERHVELRKVSERWTLIRHEQGGSVHVNGREMHNAMMHPGDQIRLGESFHVEFHLPGVSPEQVSGERPAWFIPAACGAVVLIGLLIWLLI